MWSKGKVNDFTKEELLEILNGMDDYYLANSGIKIGEKLQSMIDNYCVHELAVVLNVTQGRILRCIKCERVFN